FRVFREVWSAEGWPFLHYRVFDNRSREIFLTITLRVFLLAVDTTKRLEDRTVACFSLCTFFDTQPTKCSPSLLSVDRIPVTRDHYTTLLELPRSLTEAYQPLQPPAAFVLASLVRRQVFYILPHSGLCPYNPRSLPREIYADASSPIDPREVGQRKPGRPSKREQNQRAKVGWQTLVTCLNTTTVPPSRPSATSTHELVARPPGSSAQYHADKTALLRALDEDTTARTLVAEASREALSRMEQIRDDTNAAQEGGLLRARGALQTCNGLLDLRRTASPASGT
ncbi:hypothetical protein HDZ31DRAFT_51157, partial [Schizophyllum fasciatum]